MDVGLFMIQSPNILKLVSDFDDETEPTKVATSKEKKHSRFQKQLQKAHTLVSRDFVNINSWVAMKVRNCWAHFSRMVFILHNLKRFSFSEISKAEFHYYYQNDMQMRFNFQYRTISWEDFICWIHHRSLSFPIFEEKCLKRTIEQIYSYILHDRFILNFEFYRWLKLSNKWYIILLIDKMWRWIWLRTRKINNLDKIKINFTNKSVTKSA